MRKHHELKAWQEAMALVQDIYRATGTFPHSEQYGLISQLRRAAVSVPSNIAEGAARESSKGAMQFLVLARGSLSDLETQLPIAEKLNYPLETTATALKKTNLIFALIGGLILNLRQRSTP